MNKPIITINGSDNLFDLIMKTKSALMTIYNQEKTDSILDEFLSDFFKQENISGKMMIIENYVQVEIDLSI
jgi:hypothetical protein